MSRPRIVAVQSGIWSLYLPVPVFWGVVAAWIPVPPSVMGGVLFGALAYALLNYLFSLRQWDVDDADLPIVDDQELLEIAR